MKMSSLQLSSCRVFDRSSTPVLLRSSSSSSFWSRDYRFFNGVGLSRLGLKEKVHFRGGAFLRVYALSIDSSSSSLKVNLNEYMVTLEKPLGIRFALLANGQIFVHALKRGGNAERSKIIMVGDTLKKVSDSSGGRLIEIKDFGDAQKILTGKTGSFTFVLERPSSPFPIQQLLTSDIDNLHNRGHIPIATWNKNVVASNLRMSSEDCGNSGFVLFSSKFLTSQGWRLLNNQKVNAYSQSQKNNLAAPIGPVVCFFSEEDSGDGEWGHGNFHLEEYIKALDRSKGELYYNHSLGMRYSKITEQIYVGSCIQTEADVEALSVVGITAIINFQGGTEAENWGIDSKSINESCQKFKILMVNYPIRDADSFDIRKKLPFTVGLLLRLLKKNHRVLVTCTSGFDRSAACVIAYLHWMTDTSLHAAYNFVTGLHLCKPDRPAIAWATWDLVAMVESGRHDGPATHSVTFVWNGHEGDNVCLVGDFTGNWKEPITTTHKGGPRYETEVRLPQGKYYYKYIINDQWRHSTSSPTERDERGNINNVIVVGDTASVRPSVQQQKKDANVVKVIERPLTENERFMLAKAARCVAFSVCPIRLRPK